MAAIVFGSPEARAIVAKDKELQRYEEEEEPQGDASELTERLEDIEHRIEVLQSDILGLEDEAERIRTKLKENGGAVKRAGYTALNKWNEWAKGATP